MGIELVHYASLFTSQLANLWSLDKSRPVH